MGRLVLGPGRGGSACEGYGGLGSPLSPRVRCFLEHRHCTLAVAAVSQELGRACLQEALGPRGQAVRTLNSCPGNLSHVTAENALLKAWPPYKAFRGEQVLKSGLVRVKSQKTGAKNSQIAKVGLFHKGQP